MQAFVNILHKKYSQRDLLLISVFCFLMILLSIHHRLLFVNIIEKMTNLKIFDLGKYASYGKMMTDSNSCSADRAVAKPGGRSGGMPPLSVRNH